MSGDDTSEKSKKRLRTQSPEQVDNEFPAFNFNANQVVNRFLEVYSTTYKLGNAHRLELLGELFAENVAICSLKNNKQMLSGHAAFIQSFKNTQPSECHSTRRVFIGDEEGRQKSFVIDFYRKGRSPGLGDPRGDVVIVYETENSKIVRMYGGNDKEGISAAKKYEKSDFLLSNVWSTVKQLLALDGAHEPHYHDYSVIETWG